jgi:hypothetical protein
MAGVAIADGLGDASGEEVFEGVAACVCGEPVGGPVGVFLGHAHADGRRSRKWIALDIIDEQRPGTFVVCATDIFVGFVSFAIDLVEAIDQRLNGNHRIIRPFG